MNPRNNSNNSQSELEIKRLKEDPSSVDKTSPVIGDKNLSKGIN